MPSSERVRAAVPIARVLYIEPDIFDPDHTAKAAAPAEAGGGTEAH